MCLIFDISTINRQSNYINLSESKYTNNVKSQGKVIKQIQDGSIIPVFPDMGIIWGILDLEEEKT